MYFFYYNVNMMTLQQKPRYLVYIEYQCIPPTQCRRSGRLSINTYVLLVFSPGKLLPITSSTKSKKCWISNRPEEMTVIKRFVLQCIGILYAIYILIQLMWRFIRRPVLYSQRLRNYKCDAPKCLQDDSFGSHQFICLKVGQPYIKLFVAVKLSWMVYLL